MSINIKNKIIVLLLFVNISSVNSQTFLQTFNIFSDAKNIEGAPFYFRLGQGTKLAINPILKSEYGWEKIAVFLYGTVIYDSRDKKFKMWYRTISTSSPSTFICYAESLDGIIWSKPLNKNSMSTVFGPNNIVLSTNQISGGMEACSVLSSFDNIEHKLFFIDTPYNIELIKNNSHLYETNWNASTYSGSLVINKLPLITDEVGYVVNKIVNDSIVFLGRSILGNRNSTISKSKDIVNWTKPREIIKASDINIENCVPYYTAASNFGNILIGLTGIYNTKNETIYPTFCYSLDFGNNWKIANSLQQSIRLSSTELFDSKIIYVNSNPFIFHEGEVWCFYSGFNVPHGSPLKEGSSSIGLLRWPEDEFIGFTVADHIGKFYIDYTPSLPSIILNLQFEDGGFLQVAVSDESGNILNGYSFEDFKPIFHSKQTYIEWRDRKNLEMLIGKKVRLVFQGKNCTIFSLVPTNELTSLYENKSELIYKLEENYPNPFNQNTLIQYSLLEMSEVKMQIFNLLGQLVDELVDTIQDAGYYRLVWTPNKLSSGIYFCVLEAHSEVPQQQYRDVKKVMYLK